ncbi:MAG TPA: asparagine synthase (glutamine-hydrolyzing) [Verrucomicrobiae bacterium]|nr:asparagine synthase (glutamine-hydrolyzing) [Verrucomicrobiae bacterium]
MCGISGIMTRGSTPVDSGRVLAMRDDQRHRGPDSDGLYAETTVALGFNRLAIIDLSPAANQPMRSDDGSVVLIFNGEIYNFQDLRARLQGLGRTFRTRSDTEVILEGYRQWGPDVFPMLHGMFAIALWDAGARRLHLVRDRFGKKPIFYSDRNGEVVFASELHALLRGLSSRPEVDPGAIPLYLVYRVVPGTTSIFRGVQKVPPATCLTFDAQGARAWRYFRPSFAVKRPRSEAETLEELEPLLRDAVRRRLISDVPLGAFLSGGVDSSIVTAFMAAEGGRVRTFTVSMPSAGIDEGPYARLVARHLGTDHNDLAIEPHTSEILPRLVWHYGEPFADSSAVPSYYVSEAARRDVTVALNGDGGDESFTGYHWHLAARCADVYRGLVPGPLRQALAPLAPPLARAGPGPARALGKFLIRWGNRDPRRAPWIWGLSPEADLDGLLDPAFAKTLSLRLDQSAQEAYATADGAEELDRALALGLETYLPDDLLVKMDIASMAHSLEARSPLLDHRVVELMATVPGDLKMKRLEPKHLLKKLASRFVPPSVIYRRKQGFAIPVAEWLRGPLWPATERILTGPRLKQRGILNGERIAALLREHAAGADHQAILWTLLWLELWFRMFVDGDLTRDQTLDEVA